MCLFADRVDRARQFHYLLSYEHTRDAFEIPHDLAILAELRRCPDGAYASAHRCWKSYYLADLVGQGSQDERAKWQPQIVDLRRSPEPTGAYWWSPSGEARVLTHQLRISLGIGRHTRAMATSIAASSASTLGRDPESDTNSGKDTPCSASPAPPGSRSSPSSWSRRLSWLAPFRPRPSTKTACRRSARAASNSKTEPCTGTSGTAGMTPISSERSG